MNDRTPTEATWKLVPAWRVIGKWEDGKPIDGCTSTKEIAERFRELGCEVRQLWDAASPPAPAAEPVAFTYRNWRGEVSERHVRIIGIRFGFTEWHPEPQLLLRAFDLDKGEEREFAVNDIGPYPLDAAAIRAEARRQAEGWRSLDDCPSDGSPIWLASFEEGQWWVTEREADGEWWRSMSTRRMWMPRQPAPAPPAGGRDNARD